MANSSTIYNKFKSVVLGHPDLLIAEGIASILLKAGYKVLGRANTEANLNEQVLQHQPDIILFDPAICEYLVDTICALRQQAPESIIVLLYKSGVGTDITEAIKAGASGFISVDISPEEFVKSLELLSTGGVVVSRNMANCIRKEMTTEPKPKTVEMLSNREREILGYIGNGSTNRQIARKLFVSEHTVKVHVRGILNKLNFKNRQQVAAYAAEEGLITHPDSENGKEPAS